MFKPHNNKNGSHIKGCGAACVSTVIRPAGQSRDCAFRNVYNKLSVGNTDTFAVALLDHTLDKQIDQSSSRYYDNSLNEHT